MRWLLPLARVVGASFPFWSSLVQAQAEHDARAVQARLRILEDPISGLHPDVRELAREIYEHLQGEPNASKVQLDDGTMSRYARPLAMLEAHGLIKGTHTFGRRYAGGIWLPSPTFVMYMAALYEDPDLIERFVARVDSASAGTWLRGEELAYEHAVPLRVVRAVFELYELQGLGLLSKTLGETNYMARA